MAELVGQKCGMTRLFTGDGAAIPVTVIKVEPHRVVQVKDDVNDGYRAVQVTFGAKPLSKVSKAEAGHYAKANSEPGVGLWELFLVDGEGEDFKVGTELKVDIFQVGDKVDIQGVSKGKGFAGVIKRYHFSMQDATHGNSLSHRAPGSIGQRQTPGRVFKGKKMAGHMGSEKCTMQNQKVLRVDTERNLIFINGGIPGAPNGNVVIKHSVKKTKNNQKK
ncbi:MAG: 50S ribosomal protein L3 [Gammaproteobacteria bacterium GWE2_37_16]|nr:MAG: 50S ribosomal protein L3 [Gammaproteobacteria bacterium GWE2_37_16]